MLSRIAGRLLTGPAAFLLAGVVDLAAFMLAALRESIAARARRRRRRRASVG